MDWSRGRRLRCSKKTKDLRKEVAQAPWEQHSDGLKDYQRSARGIGKHPEGTLLFPISLAENNLEEKARGCELINCKIQAYPSYLKIPNRQQLLVKGSTCQLIMKLVDEGVSSAEISRKIARKTKTEYYSAGEIEQLVQTCNELLLNGSSPLATADWENEPIEGWWFMEEGHCEALRRQMPVSEEVCGYDCNNGWWKHRQKQEFRDWDRFGDRSIGPESKRRRT
ncbi:hypothetical protein RBB50_001777 [Rhinocladiella similis]